MAIPSWHVTDALIQRIVAFDGAKAGILYSTPLQEVEAVDDVLDDFVKRMPCVLQFRKNIHVENKSLTHVQVTISIWRSIMQYKNRPLYILRLNAT